MREYIAVFAVFCLMVGAMAHINGKLDKERLEHAATKEALAGEVEKGMGWMTAYEQALQAADAQRELAQACFERAVEAENARKERGAILQAAQPRQRSDTEKRKVVDDATRVRAADRLNRAF